MWTWLIKLALAISRRTSQNSRSSLFCILLSFHVDAWPGMVFYLPVILCFIHRHNRLVKKIKVMSFLRSKFGQFWKFYDWTCGYLRYFFLHRQLSFAITFVLSLVGKSLGKSLPWTSKTRHPVQFLLPQIHHQGQHGNGGTCKITSQNKAHTHANQKKRLTFSAFS